MLLRRKAVRLGWLLGSGGRPDRQLLQGAAVAAPADRAAADAPGYTAHYTASSFSQQHSPATSSQQHDEFKAEPYFQCKLSQTVGCKRVRLNVTGAHARLIAPRAWPAAKPRRAGAAAGRQARRDQRPQLRSGARREGRRAGAGGGGKVEWGGGDLAPALPVTMPPPAPACRPPQGGARRSSSCSAARRPSPSSRATCPRMWWRQPTPASGSMSSGAGRAAQPPLPRPLLSGAPAPLAPAGARAFPGCSRRRAGAAASDGSGERLTPPLLPRSPVPLLPRPPQEGSGGAAADVHAGGVPPDSGAKLHAVCRLAGHHQLRHHRQLWWAPQQLLQAAAAAASLGGTPPLFPAARRCSACGQCPTHPPPPAGPAPAVLSQRRPPSPPPLPRSARLHLPAVLGRPGRWGDPHGWRAQLGAQGRAGPGGGSAHLQQRWPACMM
jgi:hypothetical protein